MNKAFCIYSKALKKYQKGYIDEALKLCEKSITESMKNSAALNLKGLLYYLKGEADKARINWKISYECNDDKVAKKYLIDLKDDSRKIESFLTAFKLMKEYKINEALEILYKCSESDFNFINVHNSIAECLARQGNHVQALEEYNKVLTVDRRDETANAGIKQLEELGVVHKKINFKAIVAAASSVILIMMIFGVLRLVKNVKPAVKSKAVHTNVSAKRVKPKNVVKKPIQVKQPEKQAEAFPKDQIRKAIDGSDFDNLIKYVDSWKDKASGSDNDIIIEGENLIKSKGIDYFYNQGRKLLANNSYSAAIQEFKNAAEYGQKYYLYPHIIYELGVSYESMNSTSDALKYYTDYENSFDGGNYEPTVLYKLATLSSDNKDLAQSYAKKLVNKYPDSMYNNSTLKGVLNK